MAMGTRRGLAALVAVALLFPTLGYGANRKGAKRAGGTNSHGKGSHYVGGKRAPAKKARPAAEEKK